jgi:hypothetical protein
MVCKSLLVLNTIALLKLLIKKVLITSVFSHYISDCISLLLSSLKHFKLLFIKCFLDNILNLLITNKFLIIYNKLKGYAY